MRVSYDPRLADAIYVHPQRGSTPIIATLTERSREYKGLSFGEIAYFEALRDEVTHRTEHSRLENRIGLRDKTRPTVEAAKKRLKGMPRKSRSARRADTVQDRGFERTAERRRLAKIEGSGPTSAHISDAPQGSNLSVAGNVSPPATVFSTGPDTSVPTDSLEASLQAVRERMFE